MWGRILLTKKQEVKNIKGEVQKLNYEKLSVSVRTYKV